MSYCEDGDWWRSLKIAAIPSALRDQTLGTVFGLPTFGISPEDACGLVHYVALDVDADDPRLLRRLAGLFPRGARVWPTHTGRAYHLWVFPSDPLPLRQAKAFVAALAEAIAEAFGNVPVELFPGPNGSGPRPLRWIGTVNPKTGLRECFVDLRRPRLRDRFDDALILLALRDGLGRTPSALFAPEAIRRPRRPAPRPTPLVATNAATPAAPEASPTSTAEPRTVLDGLLCNEAFAAYVAKAVGTCFAGHARDVACPLHRPDRHPSATWLKTESGPWVLYCHHAGLVLDLPTLLTLAETGQLARVRGLDRKAIVLRHAAAAGLLRPAVEQALAHAEAVLKDLLASPEGTPTDPPNRQLRGSVGGPADRPEWRVWAVLAELFRTNADRGMCTILAPVREIGRRAGLPKEEACRLLNWLCAVGFLRKLSRGPNRAQGLTLVLVDPSEASRRARLLGPWRACNRRRVAKVLGEAEAGRIFFGQPEHAEEPVPTG